MRAVALVPAVALLAGATIGAADAVAFAPPALLLLALVVASIVAYAWQRSAVVVVFVAAAFACGGWCLAADAKEKALHTSLRQVLEHEFGGFDIDTLGPGGRHDPIRFRGLLLEDAIPNGDVTTLRVRVTEVEVQHAARRVDGVIALSIATTQPHDDWRAGRTMVATATFRRPARYLDEGVSDFERDVAIGGATLFASVKSALLVEVTARGSPVQEAAARVRHHVRRAVARWVGPHDPLSAAIAAAVLIGDRSGLPDEVRDRLQAAGTYHVIAISGGNIAILAGFSFACCFLVGITGRAAATLTLAVLLLYAEVVTAGPSVWRATLMAALYLTSRILDHRTPPWQAMAVAATLVVCVNPLDVRDAGFILTFGATAALLEGARRTMTERVPRRMRWLVASLVASAAAEIVLLPVSAAAFSRVTIAGLLLNLLAVPLMTVVQMAAMVVSIADRLDTVAWLAGWLAHLAARGILWSSTLVDVAPWLTARVAPPGWPIILAYYSALAVALLSHRLVRSCAGVAVIAAGVVISTGVGVSHSTLEPGQLRLTVFDVGQGDSELVELPDRSTLLVDTGGIAFGSSGFDIGARVLAPALWAKGLRRIDTLLLTHGDPDHIGGARAIAEDFDPVDLWQGIPVARHVPMRDLLRRARAEGVDVEERTAGEQIPRGEVRIRVLHPPQPDWERPRVRNDDSVVLEIVYRDVAMLLTGDISAEVEQMILPQLTPAPIRILKVAHHGSKTSSSAAFLETWRPQIAIISCGRGNAFGHPAPEVIQRLGAVGARVYRTDRDGEVTLVTDGGRVDVRTFVGSGR